jgi:hypothetical protein
MSDTPETDIIAGGKHIDWQEHIDDLAALARKLERKRDEARQFAEVYREFWKCLSGIVDPPNYNPFSWINEKAKG